MAESETLHDVFVDELKDAYDAEKQLIKALRKMSKAASHPDLASAFATHLEETVSQVSVLEEVFGTLDMRPKGKHCPGIAGIIEEGNEAMEEKEKSPVLDACLVGGGKRAEHYEIAAYTTLVAMANHLGYEEAAEKLGSILAQEIATNEKLDGLAEMLLPLAIAGDGDEEEEDDEGAEDDNADGEDDAEDAKPARAQSGRGESTSGGRSTGGSSTNGAKKSPARKAPAKKTSRSR